MIEPIPLTSRSAPSSILLETTDVGFAYGGVWAVRDCSVQVKRGLCTGLIGPNGAGKSTLIELISGFLRPHVGTIAFDSSNITSLSASEVARRGVTRTFQIPRLLPRLPVIENVLLAEKQQRGEGPLVALFGVRRWREQEEQLRLEALSLLRWLHLDGYAEQAAGTLSGGQARLLEMARAMMAKPTLLLLDEPTAGVYPETSRLMAVRIREMVTSGVTVLVIAHNMQFLENVADEVIVMAEGRVLTTGSVDEVRINEDVINSYLGSGIVAGNR